jgi:hypothetical protein
MAPALFESTRLRGRRWIPQDLPALEALRRSSRDAPGR